MGRPPQSRHNLGPELLPKPIFGPQLLTASANHDDQNSEHDSVECPVSNTLADFFSGQGENDAANGFLRKHTKCDPVFNEFLPKSCHGLIPILNLTNVLLNIPKNSISDCQSANAGITEGQTQKNNRKLGARASVTSSRLSKKFGLAAREIGEILQIPISRSRELRRKLAEIAAIFRQLSALC